MDSTAYKYFITDFRQKSGLEFANVPMTFVTSPVAHTKESLSGLARFLEAIAGSSRGSGRLPLPPILTAPGNFFGQLFLEAHKALAEVAAGEEPMSHRFHTSGSELVKFLCFCAQGKSKAVATEADGADLAMYCFLLEGLSDAGWCPDGCEAVAKRSARSYFVALKKRLHGVCRTSPETILCYMWGAWLLAQKTEGICDTAVELHPPSTEVFAWQMGNASQSYVGLNSLKPHVFHLLARSSSCVPHPVTRLCLDGRLGLTIHANGEAVCPVTLEEASDIVRPNIMGNKFVYACSAAPLPAVRWTAVFLVLESTTYRIDILRFAPVAKTLEVRGELRLENKVHLDRTGPDCYLGRDVENMVIRFVENPLNLQFAGQEEPEASVFRSAAPAISPAAPLTIVTAWSRGKGITAISETRLLGIYD
jgi:hypothetical protein